MAANTLIWIFFTRVFPLLSTKFYRNSAAVLYQNITNVSKNFESIKCFTIYQPSFIFNMVKHEKISENSLYQLEVYTPLH